MIQPVQTPFPSSSSSLSFDVVHNVYEYTHPTITLYTLFQRDAISEARTIYTSWSACRPHHGCASTAATFVGAVGGLSTNQQNAVEPWNSARGYGFNVLHCSRPLLNAGAVNPIRWIYGDSIKLDEDEEINIKTRSKSKQKGRGPQAVVLLHEISWLWRYGESTTRRQELGDEN